MNKEQRLEIYHRMLNDFRAFDKEDLYADLGFCRWCGKNNIRLKDLTELIHQKPHALYNLRVGTKRFQSTYWWKPDNNARRIKAIQDAINLVK